MNYICKNPNGKYEGERCWTGTVQNLKKTGCIIEAKIEGRGSTMHVIIGKYAYGNYICIPGWNVGSDLSELTDYFWNKERLGQQMSQPDAITVAEALRMISTKKKGMA